MTKDEALQCVISTLNRVIEEKGETAREISAESVLLGGDLPIDSLDLATIVVQLEASIGLDPFSGGFVNFRTVGELADLYTQS